MDKSSFGLGCQVWNNDQKGFLKSDPLFFSVKRDKVYAKPAKVAHLNNMPHKYDVLTKLTSLQTIPLNFLKYQTAGSCKVSFISSAKTLNLASGKFAKVQIIIIFSG